MGIKRDLKKLTENYWSVKISKENLHSNAEALRILKWTEQKYAGIGVIQIDEPALREGLPLRRSGWDDFLKWAVQCFRIASCAVKDETQIHTHMCYSEFNDIIESIAEMDAYVISIESSRSQMELLDAFIEFKYLKPSLQAMVEAAKMLRREFDST